MQERSPAPADFETVVAVARSLEAAYLTMKEPIAAPELPSGCASTVALAALRDLFSIWGLDRPRAGTPEWNPLGALIPPGVRVVLKPNWVLHENRAGAGLDCLVTHPSVIEAALEYVALTRPSEVTIGDAPLQGCDFQALMDACGIDKMVGRFRDRGLPVRIADFRRTILRGRGFADARAENCRDLDAYVLFDLAEQSLLEPLARDAGKFRVTMYDPALLNGTHAPGKHQYLVAREVIAAGVVLSLPKLKSHKKSCITGALKNMVGINGNKEFLPHHRKGGSASGGDCYAGQSWLKSRAEDLLDAANGRPEGWARRSLAQAAELAARSAQRLGADDNLEGSWYGNDTVWRTVLDLQRILRYGKLDGSLDPAPQRTVITLTDAIVGGEGEGPLASTPIASGFLTGALNPAAAEWVHARLMGFDPCRIPLVREAFGDFPYPLASFSPAGICVAGEVASPVSFRPAEGWRGHCELA